MWPEVHTMARYLRLTALRLLCCCICAFCLALSGAGTDAGEAQVGPQQALMNEALAQAGRGELRGATDTLDRYVTIYPSDWLGWYNRGTLRYRQGMYPQAVSDLEAARKLSDTFRVRKNLVLAYIGSGRALEAAVSADQWWQEAMKNLPPELEEYAYLRGDNRDYIGIQKQGPGAAE